jgi:glucan biosynthesis protein
MIIKIAETPRLYGGFLMKTPNNFGLLQRLSSFTKAEDLANRIAQRTAEV